MTQDPQGATPGPMRKILIATDFSPASGRARDYALALAAPGATLTLVQAHFLPLPEWPEPAYVPDWMPADPSVREEALERLRRFGAPALAAGFSVRTVLQEGEPADVILDQAAALQPDLIAIGTHGRRNFERWLMGSTAERVVRLAPFPVLTVGTESLGPPPRIRGVLCPLGSAVGSATLAFASDLSTRYGSGLIVMHVLDRALGHTPGRLLEKRAHDRLLEALATGRYVGADALIRDGRPWREILRVAQERVVDVIVMGVHDRLTSDRAFFGSTTDKVVRRAKCAVITVRSLVETGSAEGRGAERSSVGALR